MYSIDIQFDTAGLQTLINKLRHVADQQELSRTIATSLVGEVRDRIHVRGLDKNGAQIGTYSKAYMVLRSGSYQNSGKKNSGFFSKGKQSVFNINSQKPVKVKESVRPNYNRGGDTKVVLSLTRQMENDFSVVSNGSDGFGLGYKNELNFKKSQWAEETYKKEIFALTAHEETLVMDTVTKWFKDAGIS